MDEADVSLKLLHPSILDIYKVIESLVCCLKGIWVHPSTITPARLAPYLGSQGHLWSDNDVNTSWLRLISTSDPFMHPYYAYTKCLSYWYAVSRACWCTLIPLHRPSSKLAPDLGIQVHLRSENNAITSCFGLISTSDHFIHTY
jgi:hypothetical protein